MSIAEAAEVHDVHVRVVRHVGVGGLLIVGVVLDANVPKLFKIVLIALPKRQKLTMYTFMSVDMLVSEDS